MSGDINTDNQKKGWFARLFRVEDREAALISRRDDSFVGLDNRLFDPFSIIVILSGIILFMGGLGIDLSTPKYPEISGVFEACTPPVESACERAVRDFDRVSHAASTFSWRSFWAGTLEAIGLTIVAAVFISSTVDRRTRFAFFKQLAKKTEALGSAVLLGMFESRHHPRLFALIKENILEKNIIRKNIDINYTLVDLAEDFAGTRLEGERYLKVDVILSTVTENINIAQNDLKGAIRVPIKLGLPNPILDELKPFVRVNGFRIGDKQIESDDIEKINVKLQEKLNDDTQVDATIEIGEHFLQPGEQITVSGSYTMIKELQDTEVFRSIEIAENIHLTVVNRASEDLEIRARSLAHGTLHPQKSPSAQQWKLDELSLPLQGIMVWWKKSPKGPSPLNATESIPTSQTATADGEGH